jgi:hypothetical protein
VPAPGSNRISPLPGLEHNRPSPQPSYRQESFMVLCPVAIAVGCRKCPIFAACPVKGIIGDYKKEDEAPARPSGGAAKDRPKKKK